MNKNKNIIDKLKLLTDPRVLGLLAFGVIALLITFSGIKVIQTNYELDKKIAVTKQRNDIARLENENLKLKNTYYQTNQYLELSARRQFGKAAPGEKLYVVPESVALARTIEVPKPDQIQVVEEDKRPKYQQNVDAWMEFLFH